MRYAIMKYLRLSSEDIDLDGLGKYESNSIANQRAFLDDFISKMPETADGEILEAFDDGWTGTNFQRPGIKKVLDMAQQGKIHCIVVKDLSRFGRNYLEVGDYLEQIFPAWGIRFISINDMYDSANYNGTTGGIDIAFRNLIAEMYSQDLSEKVRSAKNTINKSGRTSAPYGFYGYVLDTHNRQTLIIDEPAAEIVRLIFNLYEQGMTAQEIAMKLNEDGVKTPNEHKREQGAKRDWKRNSQINMWDKCYINNLLRNERYTGKHIYGKRRRIELGRSATKAVPESEWIVVPNAYPAIITDEQFIHVRELASAKVIIKNKSTVKKTPSPFQRKIRCGYCGKALMRNTSQKNRSYKCHTPKFTHGLGCSQSFIREDEVIKTVLTVINQQAEAATEIKKQKTSKTTSSALTVDNLRSEIQCLKKLVDSAKSTKMALWEKQHTGKLTREAFQTESDKLTEQTAEYIQKITELKAKVFNLEMESGQENTFVERFSKQVGIKELTQEVVNEFIKVIYVYSPDRIEIILNYADEYKKAVALID
jgi:DNA invertase Pin-like site-specific DNA recombinase